MQSPKRVLMRLIKTANALEKLERPFLTIEVRGQIKNQVWAVNKGKVPAHLIWFNETPTPVWLKIDEVFPPEYNYGAG